ncbi:4965_t:CDS:2 [Paraglomus occultum]|uniref:4965_t:CDS:1 n=1 Tax=Paraglomus occultum TaxID=144539 RepID=A0A9N8W3A3_9GLOM|nr:4965_t:CDS:2 [Paraglomus occultum]
MQLSMGLLDYRALIPKPSLKNTQQMESTNTNGLYLLIQAAEILENATMFANSLPPQTELLGGGYDSYSTAQSLPKLSVNNRSLAKILNEDTTLPTHTDHNRNSREQSTLLSALTASLTQLSHSHSVQLSRHSVLNSENRRLTATLRDIKIALIELKRQKPVLKILRRLNYMETLEEIDISEENVVDLFLELTNKKEMSWNRADMEEKTNAEEIKEWKEESSGCQQDGFENSLLSLLEKYPKCRNYNESVPNVESSKKRKCDNGDNDSVTKKHKEEKDVREVIPDPEASKQPPRFESDMYTPRWVRGVGKSKEGLCPHCNPPRWYKTKISAYWYHLNYQHGISSITGRPFAGPVSERNNKKSGLREALCHKCGKWILNQSPRDKEVLVPEIYW